MLIFRISLGCTLGVVSLQAEFPLPGNQLTVVLNSYPRVLGVRETNPKRGTTGTPVCRYKDREYLI